jgi:hypothetical protein
VEESSDDGSSDAYSGINIRVSESAVASVDVVPGARVVFSIEPSAVTAKNNYLRFKATSANARQYGRLILASWTDVLQRWESAATA